MVFPTVDYLKQETLHHLNEGPTGTHVGEAKTNGVTPEPEKVFQLHPKGSVHSYTHWRPITGAVTDVLRPSH